VVSISSLTAVFVSNASASAPQFSSATCVARLLWVPPQGNTDSWSPQTNGTDNWTPLSNGTDTWQKVA